MKIELKEVERKQNDTILALLKCKMVTKSGERR